ncbi:MAG: tetratricopeptide repeat protein, partial [Acidobacteriota bacterium]
LAVVKPPKDPATRASVDELERAIATARQLAEAEKLTEATAALPELKAAQALHYRPVEASLLLTRGLIEYRATDIKTSIDTLTSGIVAAEAAGDDKLAAGGWIDLMGNLADIHHLDEARVAGRHASALLERIGGNPRFEAKLLEYQGWTEVYDGKQGTPYFDRALDLRERTLPPEDPDLLGSLELEARELAAKHEFDKSLALHQRILAAREKLYGPDAPMVAWSLFGIASNQRRLGDERGAVQNLTRALAIYDSAAVKTAAPRLFVLESLALAHAGLGEHDQAVDYGRRAVELGEKLAATRQPADLAAALATYATVLREHGDYAGALAQAERALAVVDKSLPPNNGLFVAWLVEVGLARLGLGRAADAVEPLERAVKIVDQHVPADDWNNDQPAQARFALARVLRALGKDEPRARELAGKARELWAAWGTGKTDEVAQVDAFLSASR